MSTTWEAVQQDAAASAIGRLAQLGAVDPLEGDLALPRRRNAMSLLRWLADWAGRPFSSEWKRYSMVLIAVATATLVRSSLDPWLGDAAPHACFLIATMCVAWRCGLGPALTTVALGAIVSTYFFVQPRYHLLSFTEPESPINLMSSLFIGVSISLLSESLRMTAAENARLYAEAKRADHRKDEFLAMLSHELRNPLVPLRNALFVLQAKGEMDADLVAARDLMQGQIDHLLRMVDDLLDVSRVSRGVVTLKLEPTLLSDVIRPAVDIARPLIEEKGQQLTLELAPQAVYASADRIRLTQAVANLLNNAARYTDPGGKIWLSTEQRDGTISLRVRDTGIGIEPEMIEKIFDLFQQGHAAGTYAQGGLGIGLTLAKNLVEMHGGSIDASSPGPGKGSEFAIHLPTCSAPRSTRQHPSGTNQTPTRRRVLVVDDSEPSAQSMARVLRLLGHDVLVSHDANSALEQARNFHPDVVLSDISLPGMDGYRLAAELRRLPGLDQATLIAVTGHGQSEDRLRALESGFDLHLLKPVNPEDLAQLLSA